MKTNEPDIREFLSFFPEIAPPLTLSEETHSQFNTENKPFAQHINAFLINKWEEADEYTEFMPCLRMKVSDNFHTLIYWKGALLTYEYIIVTITDKLELISKKVIAGTISNGETVKSSVAYIDEEFYMYTISGGEMADNNYDPTSSSAYSFMIMPNGKIESNKEELFPK